MTTKSRHFTEVFYDTALSTIQSLGKSDTWQRDLNTQEKVWKETHRSVSCLNSVRPRPLDCVQLLENFSHSDGQDSVAENQHESTVWVTLPLGHLLCVVSELRQGLEREDA